MVEAILPWRYCAIFEFHFKVMNKPCNLRSFCEAILFCWRHGGRGGWGWGRERTYKSSFSKRCCLLIFWHGRLWCMGSQFPKFITLAKNTICIKPDPGELKKKKKKKEEKKRKLNNEHVWGWKFIGLGLCSYISWKKGKKSVKKTNYSCGCEDPDTAAWQIDPPAWPSAICFHR